jgi:hypothetical protein
MSPTSRSLNYAKKRGWIPSVCERYCSYTRRRFDLFGVFDLIVLDDLWGCIGVQTTSGSNVSARIHKMEDSPHCRRWLAAGLRAEVWGWRQIAAYRKDGSRAAVDRWTIRIVRLQPTHPIAATFGDGQRVIVPLAAEVR